MVGYAVPFGIIEASHINEFELLLDTKFQFKNAKQKKVHKVNSTAVHITSQPPRC